MRVDSMRYFRRSVLVLVPCVLALGAWYLYRFGSPMKCGFYQLTGLYCPGCGSGRAAAAFLRGNHLAAFRYNPMLFLLGVPAALIAGWEILAFALPEMVKTHVRIPQRAAWTVCSLVFAFWIARNLPIFSFLAP